jgi:4-diphosphocytidyl-2C-methyl-D-erythritol kinase
LEETTEKFCGLIKEVKKILRNFKIKAISVSGSGPAVFGIVSSRKEGKEICRQLSRDLGDGFGIFLVKTL